MEMQTVTTVTTPARNKAGRLPLIDPRKDLITVSNSHTSDVFRQAYEYVCDRAVKDALVMSYEGNRTKPYPIMSGICCLHAEAEKLLRQRIRTVYGALQKIVATYHHDPVLQEFLDIPPELKRWVIEDSDPKHRSIDLCRFDMMGKDLDSLRVIEFNANAPGGIVYSGLINTYWRAAPGIGKVIEGWDTQPTIFERETWFADFLKQLAQRRGIEFFDSVGLLHPIGGNILEMPHLQKRFQKHGYKCTMTSPPETIWDEKPSLRVAYLKYGVQRTLQDISTWDAFCAHVVNGDIVIPSSLAGRWIGDNKLCLAVMSDPRFSYLFSPAERKAMRLMIPWSRKLGEGVSVQEVLADKDYFVLKNPYGTRGAAIYLGLDHSIEEWKAIVAHPQSAGYLVQEYIDSSTSISGVSPYYRDLAATIANGRIVGYASRVSREHKVNMAQDGNKLSVLSTLGDTQ